MKYNRFGVFAAALATTALIATANAGLAIPLYWDAGLVEVNGISDGGAGAWTIGTPGWEDGSSAQNWTDGSDAFMNGVPGTMTLGGPISAGNVTVQTSGYTFALANNALTAASLNYSGDPGGSLTITGGAGTTSAQNLITLNGPGSGWAAGTSINLNGSANPGVGSTQNGALAKLRFGDVTALGSAEIKIKHGMIQAGAPGMTITNNITNAGASMYFGGENDFAVNGLVKGDGNNARTLGVFGSSNGSRTITLGDIDTVGTGTVNFEARGTNNNSGGGFIVNGKITGAGGVSTVGTGQFAGNTLTLNGANDYTGATSMIAGRLQLNGSLTSAVTISSGATISGPGSTSGLLTLNGGSRLALAGGATTTSLTAAGVNFAGVPAIVFDTPAVQGTVYDVVTYGTGPVTNAANLKATSRGTITDTGSKFTFTAGLTGAQTRTWNVTDGTWDIGTTPNWQEGDQLFYNGDNAVFNNPAAASTVTLAGTLLPASVTVNNTNQYTFNGTGAISGATSLAKSGSGALAIGSRQSYTGGTTVNGGVLDLTGGGGDLGTIRGAVTVTNNGLLKLSTGDATGYAGGASALTSINLVDSTLNVSVAGAGNNQTLGSATVTMTGSSITGIAGSNLDFFGNGSALTTLASPNSSVISLPTFNLRQNDTVVTVADGGAADDLLVSSSIGNGAGGNHNLIKNGPGTLKLTANNTFTGTVTINGGVLDIASGGLYRNAAGAEAYNNGAKVTINTGGTLRLQSYSYNGEGGLGGAPDYAVHRVINGGTLEVVGASQSGGQDFTVGENGGTFRYAPANPADTLTQSGTTNSDSVLDGALTFNTVGNVTFTGANAAITGPGSLTKTGGGTLTFANNNTYTGDTVVSEGTLVLAGSQASDISVGSGAALGLSVDTTSSTAGTVILGAGSTVTIVGTPASPTTYTLLTADSITGTPVLGTPVAGYSLEIQGGNTLVLKSDAGDDFSNWIDGFTFADPNADKTATGDPDGDGLTNFEEYAYGLAPNSGASVNPISQLLDKTSGLFKYTRRNPSATGIAYTYESSTDLLDWTTFTPDSETPDAGDPVQTVTVDVPDALLTNTKLFVRVLAK